MRLENLTFVRQDVILDFHEYYGCTFVECQILILGYGVGSFVGCIFDTCVFPFAGPAANYVQVLRAMYAQDNMRPIVEEVISLIKGEIDPPGQSQEEQNAS